jgi:hypothetical protein
MIDEHDNLIGLIYDGITDDDQWLAKIAALANAAGVGLGLQEMWTHEYRSLGADPAHAYPTRPRAADSRSRAELLARHGFDTTRSG